MPSNVEGDPGYVEMPPFTLQNGATGTGNGTAMTMDAKTESLNVTVSGGIATVIPEHSFDAGSTWELAVMQDLTTGAAALVTTITAAVAPQRFIYKHVPGANRFRMRISAFVSGAITSTAIERRFG